MIYGLTPEYVERELNKMSHEVIFDDLDTAKAKFAAKLKRLHVYDHAVYHGIHHSKLGGKQNVFDFAVKLTREGPFHFVRVFINAVRSVG